MANEPKAYTIREAAEAMRIGRSTLYTLINSDKIKTVKILGRVIVPASEVARLINGGAA